MQKNKPRDVRIMHLFTHNSYAALRRPAGFSQEFLISPYPSNGDTTPVWLNCSVFATMRESTNCLEHSVYIFGARNLNYTVSNFIFMASVRLISVTGTAHMQSRVRTPMPLETHLGPHVEWSLKLSNFKENANAYNFS
jgi:hypothetical protein